MQKRKEKLNYRLVTLPVEGSRCLSAIQRNASMQRKVPFVIFLTSTMGDLTCAKKADMYCMYGCANGNSRAALRMHPVQFTDHRMPDHKIFQRLYRRLREILERKHLEHCG
ncbi:hypothetical protein TNCV_166451 [Trichonephila clavipes]|nr:hypothetical protein TNCV_166451 [Trichonephila clavipes]